MNGVTVRHAKLEDACGLEQFYYRAYGERARYKYPERWNWHFRDNPWRDNDRLPVYVIEAPDGQIVGCTASIRVPCKIFDNQIKLGWSVDTIVVPESRGMGAGKILQKINQDDHPAFASLSMNAINRRIKLKLGAVLGPSTKVYIKLLKFDLNVSILTPLYAFGYAIVRLLKSFKKSGNNDIGHWKIDGPGHAVFSNAETELWQKIRNRYDFAVERNADYLNWRYRDQPWTKYYCCRAYDAEGQLGGIAVYRIAEETGLKTAIITELMGINSGDSSIFYTLLRSVEKNIVRLGGTQIQVATSDQLIEDAIEQSGYLRIDLKNLVINGPKNIIGKINLQTTAMLTKGDQDLDQYPLAHYISPIGLIKKWIKVYSKQFVGNIRVSLENLPRNRKKV